ncbi:hypothetical protein NDU88_003953, partial [Pleurodeles waltl]
VVSGQGVVCGQNEQMNVGQISEEPGVSFVKEKSFKQKKDLSQTVRHCYRCGSHNHIGNNPACPATGKRCLKCQKIGHFQAVCRQRGYNGNSGNKVRLSNVYTPDTDELAHCSGRLSNMILTVNFPSDNNISCDMGHFKGPFCEAVIDSKEVLVMADSGAPVTILGDQTFFHLWEGKQRLECADIAPKAFGDQDIDLLGFFHASLQILGRTVFTKMYVAVKGRNIVG